MAKTAIFVEGQTELIFVREYLLKWFEYADISLACYNLFSAGDAALHPTEYSFSNDLAAHHFQLINVGGDVNVLSHMLKRESRLWNQGFDRILGLRDMYSEAYRKASKGKGIVSDVSAKFIAGAREQIALRAKRPAGMTLCWAIMETEAWILGLYICFERIDKRLTPTYIREQLALDLKANDPERTYFHPAIELGKIVELVGRNYDKSKGEVNAILGYVERSDFSDLLKSNQCASFSTFHEACQAGNAAGGD